MSDLVTILITIFSAGGMAAALATVLTSRSTAGKLKAEASKIGATTSVEIESVSVATMRSALESAQTHIISLEQARKADRAYYEQRIGELEHRLETLRDEVHEAERKLTSVLASTAKTANELTRLRNRPKD